MTLTLPTVYPTGYDGTKNDFLKAKGSRDGEVRLVPVSVSVPTGSAAATVIGLVPFNKGARFLIHDKALYCSDFGAATTTVDLGVTYYNSDVGTTDADAFASAATAPQSGGYITVDEKEGVEFVAAGDGWLTATVRTATTDADGTIKGLVGVSYFS